MLLLSLIECRVTCFFACVTTFVCFDRISFSALLFSFLTSFFWLLLHFWTVIFQSFKCRQENSQVLLVYFRFWSRHEGSVCSSQKRLIWKFFLSSWYVGRNFESRFQKESPWTIARTLWRFQTGKTTMPRCLGSHEVNQATVGRFPFWCNFSLRKRCWDIWKGTISSHWCHGVESGLRTVECTTAKPSPSLSSPHPAEKSVFWSEGESQRQTNGQSNCCLWSICFTTPTGHVVVGEVTFFAWPNSPTIHLDQLDSVLVCLLSVKNCILECIAWL